MSKTIRVYKSLTGDDLTVTAYVGPNGQAAIQFTMSQNYSGLSEAQVKDLIQVLQHRLNRDKGFTATEWGGYETIDVDGKGEG